MCARFSQIVPIIWKHGLFYAICADDAWTPRMETYYIFNYFVSTSFSCVLCQVWNDLADSVTFATPSSSVQV